MGKMLDQQHEAYKYLFNLCHQEPVNMEAVFDCQEMIRLLDTHLRVAAMPSSVMDRFDSYLRARLVTAQLAQREFDSIVRGWTSLLVGWRP